MKLKKILTIAILALSFQVEAKMTEFLDSDGNLKCEIDSNGQFDIINGPCFSTILIHGKEFMCETESGEEIQITKEILRIDSYTVKAFGFDFFGLKSSSKGLVDGLVVNNTSQAQFGEPVFLTFKSSPFGDPISLAIYLQGGRAPIIEALDCRGTKVSL